MVTLRAPLAWRKARNVATLLGCANRARLSSASATPRHFEQNPMYALMTDRFPSMVVLCTAVAQVSERVVLMSAVLQSEKLLTSRAVWSGSSLSCRPYLRGGQWV